MRTLLPFLIFAAGTLLAQTPGGTSGQPATPPSQAGATQANTTRPIWRANMPGGTYEIVVGSIISVSSHEFVVDGAARVTEVNVDTTGQLAVRFYYIEPVVPTGPAAIGGATIGKVQNLLTEAADRTGMDAWKKVVKSYPTTTHARTVEYRVASKDSLNKIFTSASKCLRTGRPDEVSISE